MKTSTKKVAKHYTVTYVQAGVIRTARGVPRDEMATFGPQMAAFSPETTSTALDGTLTQISNIKSVLCTHTDGTTADVTEGFVRRLKDILEVNTAILTELLSEPWVILPSDRAEQFLDWLCCALDGMRTRRERYKGQGRHLINLIKRLRRYPYQPEVYLPVLGTRGMLRVNRAGGVTTLRRVDRATPSYT